MKSNVTTPAPDTALPSLKRFAISMFFCIVVLSLCASCNRQPRYPAPTRIGQNVAVDAASLREEVPAFFTYEYQGRPISFFIVKINGRVSSFLDACASCYLHKQGYRYDDGRVTCRACGMKFSLYQLEKGIGGCYPIKIEGRMENENYLIPLAELGKHAKKF